MDSAQQPGRARGPVLPVTATALEKLNHRLLVLYHMALSAIAEVCHPCWSSKIMRQSLRLFWQYKATSSSLLHQPKVFLVNRVHTCRGQLGFQCLQYSSPLPPLMCMTHSTLFCLSVMLALSEGVLNLLIFILGHAFWRNGGQHRPSPLAVTAASRSSHSD